MTIDRTYREGLLASVRPRLEPSAQRQPALVFCCQNAQFEYMVGTHPHALLLAFAPIAVDERLNFAGGLLAVYWSFDHGLLRIPMIDPV